MSLFLIASLTALSTNILPIADVTRLTREDARFVLEGTVIGLEEHPDYWHAIVEDDSGRINLRQSVAGITWPDTRPVTGDVVRCHGFAHTAKGGHYTWFAERVERLGRRDPPAPPVLTAAGLLASQEKSRPLRLRGVVRDAFFDELDSNYLQLSIRSEGRNAFASIFSRGATEEGLFALLGREIEIYGIEQHASGASTGKFHHYVSANSLADVRLLSPEGIVPDLEPDANRLPPEELADLGLRRITGRVLASWLPGQMLVRTPNGRISRLELLKGSLPPVDSRVSAVGLPVTDLYNVNLTKAVASLLPRGNRGESEEKTVEVSASTVLRDEQGRDNVKLNFHGRRLKITGRVRHLRMPSESGFYLDSGGHLVLVDTSTNPKLLAGVRVNSILSVTGVCVLNIDNWRPDASLPKIRDFMLVPSSSDDFIILRSPSWWTPARAILLTTLLSLALGALIVLNAFSKKVAALKYAERTRLAIELHDLIAQSLAGISMQIDAAKGSAEKCGRVRQLLEITSRSLDSCRTELRNCLWDLRNRSLEERDFSEAIRTTIRPFANEARIRIRFTLPRGAFPDSDRHAVLSIIRELVSNAIRHGHAQTVRIAGCVDEGSVCFSVRDNGLGFDPDAVPGVAEGHFGLQGIRERIKRVGGEIEFKSRPGSGTVVKVKYGKNSHSHRR